MHLSVRKAGLCSFLIYAMLQFAGCAVRNFPVIQPVEKTRRDRSAQGKAEEYFVRARDYERRGLDQMAERFYEMAHELDPSSEVLQEQLSRKYIETAKYTQALLLVKGNRKLNELSRTEKRIVSTIYLKMGEFAKAAEALESISGRSEEETYSLGLIYESLGNIGKALQRYREYFVHNSESLQMGMKIGRLYIAEKNYKAAESLYVALQERFAGSADVISMLGTVRMLTGDTVAALDQFERATEIDSLHEESLRSMAQIHLQRSSYEKAIPLYERLLRNSYYGDIYGRSLAILYYYNKQHDEAEVLLSRLLQGTPDDPELYYYLGLVFAAKENIDLAKIQIEKALVIKSDYEDAWRELCYLYAREKKYDEAIAAAKRYAVSVPESSGAWRMQGYAFVLTKEYKKAIGALTRAVATDSVDSYAWFELGSAYERDKQFAQAADAFRKVLQLKPGDPSASNYLGYMWAENKTHLDSAKLLLESALSRDPENGAYLDSYAWVFFQMGEIDTAFEYMKRAEAKLDKDPVIYSHLGDILVRKKKFAEARDAYRKCIELDSDQSEEIREKIAELEALLRGKK